MADLASEMKELMTRIELMLARRPYLPVILIVVFQSLARLPEVLAVANYSALVVPLETHYLTHLLFDGWAVRTDLAATLISPANAALIYPPGLFLFCMLTGQVAGLYWIMFGFQLAVGPLLYWLTIKVLPRVGALLLALLVAYACTRSNWWAPDFLIQPLMVGAVLFLVASRGGRRGGVFPLLFLGQIAGLIIVFKHNVGVFFSILCGVWLFLNAFRPNAEGMAQGRGKVAAWFFLAGFLIFVPVFGSRLIHIDETVYFLGPYLMFWGLFIRFISKFSLVFETQRFMRGACIFSGSALLLPGMVFLTFGSVIGYGRYWQSLFGMGLQYLSIWDHGIVGIISTHFRGSELNRALTGLAYALLFLAPFAINCFAVLRVATTMPLLSAAPRRTLADFRIAGLGIMASFMLFPLEGYHILATKLFIFFFVGIHFLRRILGKSLIAPLFVVLASLVLLAIAHSALRLVAVFRLETATGSVAVERIVGLPMQREIATALSRQVEVLQRSMHGAAYSVIDSSGGTLIGLATLVGNRLPQYYVEMRPGILSRAVVDAIKVDILRRPFVIVNLDDYSRRRTPDADPYMREMLDFVDLNFVQVDIYCGVVPVPAPAAQILDFVVMQQRSELLYK